MRTTWVVMLAVVALAMTLPPASLAADRAGSALARHLHLPHVAARKCPVSKVGSFDFSRLGVTTPGIGPGPAYATLGRSSTLYATKPATFESNAWDGDKVLWVLDPKYTGGAVLVRGRRLDGPGLVRFDRGNLPTDELRLTAGQSTRPSFTRVRAAGCYG
jgi:hypothetical protein